MFRFAGFELDPERAEMRGPDGSPIKLRRKPFDMLALFTANAGRVLSKQELIDAIWPNVHVGEDSLFQCIREIRAALGDEQRQLLKVVPGRGYVFDIEVAFEAPSSPAPTEAVSETAGMPDADITARPAESAPQRWFGLPRPVAFAVAGVGAVLGLAIATAAFAPGLIFKPAPPTIAVMPITGAGGDAQTAAMAAGVTDRFVDGLAKIENIRVIAVPSAGAAQTPSADFVVNGDLQKGEHGWNVQARMIKTSTREVQPIASVSVETKDGDSQLQQTRLAAGIGYPLAQRLNAILEFGAPPAGRAKVVIEQAMASINQTSKERFAASEKMLEEALTKEPDNTDLQVALAALQLRGIMMVWYSPQDREAVEANAKAVLERAVRTRPNSIPVLEAYCRFLVATNHFVETLPACARILSFDPWNGQALYNIGLAQINLGRFEDALATFKQANRYDTPVVSRWTWLLGIGFVSLLMGDNEEAVTWLQRSIAITPASGRSYMLLAAAYQRLGQPLEAKAAMEKGLELRPGTNAINFPPPSKNTSPIFLAASQQTIRSAVDAGMPER